MRQIFLLLSILISGFSFGQISVPGDTLKPGVYDTMQISIRSDISFPFCSNVYALPRNCRGNFPPNCCSYSTTLQKNEKVATSGSVSCDNGSSFSWSYSDLETAKSNFESVPDQLRNQQKTFFKKPVKCLVFDKEMDGCIIEQETYQGHKFYILFTYGSKNGFNFFLEYHSQNKITGNNDIQPVFNQFLRLL